MTKRKIQRRRLHRKIATLPTGKCIVGAEPFIFMDRNGVVRLCGYYDVVDQEAAKNERNR